MNGKPIRARPAAPYSFRLHTVEMKPWGPHHTVEVRDANGLMRGHGATELEALRSARSGLRSRKEALSGR